MRVLTIIERKFQLLIYFHSLTSFSFLTIFATFYQPQNFKFTLKFSIPLGTVSGLELTNEWIWSTKSFYLCAFNERKNSSKDRVESRKFLLIATRAFALWKKLSSGRMRRCLLASFLPRSNNCIWSLGGAIHKWCQIRKAEKGHVTTTTISHQGSVKKGECRKRPLFGQNEVEGVH